MAKKILVAEDNADFARMIAARLKANQYEVCVASDGIQAIAMAHKEKPDLILLDIMMPCGGGMGVMENIKKSVHTANTPIIAMTAYAAEEIRDKTMALGAKDFISKPFTPEELFEKIRKILPDEKKGA